MAQFYMGCDASKGYADFIVLSRGKRVVERNFQLDDTFEGHSQLTKFVSSFFSAHPAADLKVGIESTGGYEDNWYALLSRLGQMHALQVSRLNPLAVKKHHEACLNRNVTDAVSAQNIASYLIAYPEKVDYEQDSTFNRLRRQWTFIQLLTKQRTQLINHLGTLLYQSHPQLMQYCKESIPNWVLDVLLAYPTAKKLSRAQQKRVVKIPYISQEKARSLIVEAKKSVAAHVSQTDADMISLTVQQIKSMNTAINVQKKQLQQRCDLPEIELLCSFKGISCHSALGLIINIVSVERFATVKQLASYFGLHPVYKQSGDGSWGFHMSKKGRKQPRSILYMVTICALSCNPVIKRLYEKCLSEGREKMDAVGICMHKTLRMIYGMLRTRKPFDPQIDECNREKPSMSIEQKNNVNKKRRYQKNDDNAPISRRQTKKRNEERKDKERQKKHVPINGVIPVFPPVKSNTRVVSKQMQKDPVAVGKIIMDALACYNVKNSK